MYFGLLIHFKLLILIIKLILYNVSKSYLNGIIKLLTKVFIFFSGVWFIDASKSFAQNMYNPKMRRKQAIVILTKISTHDHPLPEITTKLGKQNAFFLERIMTEKLAYILTDLKKKLEQQNKDLSLFVCYQDRYFYKYNITDWLEHLPDYSRCQEPLKHIAHTIDERYELLTESFEKNLSKLDRSFDADSFYATKTKLCRKSANSIFKYVCVEDTEDGRALEAAIRVGLHHDNQDVLVLNPHAVQMTEDHITDALNFLEHSVDLKANDCRAIDYQAHSLKKTHYNFPDLSQNRVIYGKTCMGGLYLLGVSRSRQTLLNIRRLTRDVIWGSNSAFKTVVDHQNHLGWADACLLPVLEDVKGMESLPLVEREIGLKMEEIPTDIVSVVIPTCNHEEFIEETLDSLVYHISGKRSIQVIVVDANSSDYTLQKVSEFQATMYKRLVAGLSAFTHRAHRVKLKNSASPRRRGSNSHIDTAQVPDFRDLVSLEIHSLPSDLRQTAEQQVRYAVDRLVCGGTILLLRPGTNLPLYWDLSVRRCLNQLGVLLGTFSFNLHLHDRYIARKHIGWALRAFCTSLVFNARSRLYELPSSDTGFFMYTFYYRLLLLKSSSSPADEELGLDLPAVLDDMTLLDRVHAAGHVSTCHDVATVSPIRALRYGFCRCWLLDSLVVAADRLGASRAELARLGNDHDRVVIQPDYYDGY